MYFPRQIRRDVDGKVRLHLQPHEAALLRELLDELETLLEDPEDPALRRVFPPAHTDRESEEQYRSLVGDQLLTGRKKALATVRDTLGNDTLDPDEADAWLRASTTCGSSWAPASTSARRSTSRSST